MSSLSLSQRGAAALVRRQQLAAGVAVTYTRVSGLVLPITAVPGLTTFTSQELPGRVEIANRDYLIAVADLMFEGAEQVPALGDRIAETINGQTCVFEVCTPQTGEPAWRYSAQSRVLYRVHCKRVAL